MGIYSIRDLELLSGIKAHTLRIWEQRFDILQPKRTDTNIRYYDDEDLRRVLNISLLNQNGYKISKIAEMSHEDIQEEVKTLSEKVVSHSDQINTFVNCMVSYDKERFEKAISKCVLQHGFEDTMLKIVFPFLNKVGMLWLTGAISPAQEHFISHLIRKKIMVALDGQIQSHKSTSKTFLLFLPEGEYHELGLLFGYYLIRNRQHRVIYLGQSLPLNDLVEAIGQINPEYIFTVFTTTPTQGSVQGYINELAKLCQESKLILTGYQVVGNDLDIPNNVEVINRVDELLEFIDSM